MGANVEVVVQAAPPGALELAEAEDADDVVEQVAERLAQSGHVDVSLIREQRTHEPGASGSLTIPEVFEAVVRAASGAEGGQVRCFVASNAVRDRLRGHLGGATGRLRRFRCQAWTVVLRAGDITSVVADAVVNASNTSLKLGGGVSGALRRAAGPGLQAEMSALGGLPPGGLAVTGAHGLTTTSRVLHVATASGRLADVRAAIEKVLGYCQEQQLRSVAVPALGTGTGALDAATAASQFAEAVVARPQSDRPCELVVVLWGEATFTAFEQAFHRTPGFAPPG